MRVHELSKELGIQSKDLMNFLVKLGAANVRNHMSTIEDQYVEQVRQAFPTVQKQPRIPQLKPAVPAKPEIPSKTVTPSKAAVPAAPPKLVVDIPRSLPNKESFIPKPNTTVESLEKPNAPQAVEPPKPVLPKVEQPVSIHNNSEQSNVSKSNFVKQNSFRPNTSAPGSFDRSKPGAPYKQTVPNKPEVRPEIKSEGKPEVKPAATQNDQGRQETRGRAPVYGGQNRPGQNNQQRPNSNYRPGQNPQRPVDGQGNRNPLPGNRPIPQGSGPKVGFTPDSRKPQTTSGNRNDAQRGRPQSGGQSRPGFGGHGQASRGGNFNNRNNNNNNNRSRPGQYAPMQRTPVKPLITGTNVKSVQLPEYMSVKDFSQLIEVAAGDVIKKLIGFGVMATINQEVDRDTMTLISDEYGISATAALSEEQKLQVEEVKDAPETLQSRPPVVTIMGHVDHGKTSLLDAIRETNVTSQEAGGITQHIGAYQVEINERKITFLDTPGHEAFTAMRARGAQATDIAVLVVAADDGVMPQTVEAINHAKDANVSIIIAINKMDKPGANPERIKQDLTEYGLVAGEWGGDAIFVPVSAKKRTGIDALLEMILLVADVKDYKANPDRPAKGTIIESKLDKGRGPVATVLVQNGTLELGDSIIAGAAAGKVKALITDKGKRVKKAGPSMPVELIGFNELPDAGDILHVITEDRMARELADKRIQFKRESELRKNQKITLDDLFTKIKEGEVKELKIILKADVQGSIEAIQQSLERLSNEQVRVKVIHSGVGGIGEGDVMFASASNAIIIGFNVRPGPLAKRTADREKVDVRLYRIIYNIIEDIQKAMEGMLTPEYKEVIDGRAEVRLVYRVSKVGNIAGCYVTEGKINRNSDIRLIRNNIVVHEGKIFSLKRFKDDAKEVLEGFECGISLENYNDLKEGDIIEAFSMEEIKRTASK